MSEYPEHDKLRPVHDISMHQGMFIDWLQEEKNIVLAEYAEDDELYHTRRTLQDLLAEYHDIDLKKLDEEKRAMIDEMRKTYEASKV